MMLAARRGREWRLDSRNVAAWSGVLLLHILLLGAMLLPRAPLVFAFPQAEPFEIPLQFEPVEPPKLPPPPPIEAPPPPIRLHQSTPPPQLLQESIPEQPTTTTELVLDTPTETPQATLSEFESSVDSTAGTGASELVSLKTKYSPPPRYPRRELVSGISGRVELRVLVGADGLPQTVEVIGGSASRNFELAAVRAVKRWRFQPHSVDGKPRAAWALVPIVFRIDN